jgi:serine protease AprX
MQKVNLVLSVFLSVIISFTNIYGQNTPWNDKISPEIRAQLESGQKVDFLLIFQQQADVRGARFLSSKSEKARFVYAQLEKIAEQTQQQARALLRASEAKSNSLRLVNAIAVSGADAALTRQLASLPEVSGIAPDPWIHMQAPVEINTAAQTSDRQGIEWGVAKIHAPEVWAAGYTGQGITIGGADTGYEWGHPAIQQQYRGWNNGAPEHNYNWHDAIHEASPLNSDPLGNPCGLNTLAPCDDNNHGTHTMGTMTGDDGQGNQIGVAPGAQWVGCRNMERGWGRPSSYLECFEWFLAPTDLNGQNPNPDKAPHVINNSWYCSVEEGCIDAQVNDLLRMAVVNLKTSGVVVIISNGNFGPNCATTTGPPAYFEESFSVGATREDDALASFSSRGPVTQDGSYRMKPNVSAPGFDVRSCIRGGNYANFGGTSMAGPHVAGLVALLLSARPELAGHVADIETILEQTAVYFADTVDCGSSLGAARPNHAFGWGRVDALEALNTALTWPIVLSSGSAQKPAVAVWPNPATDQLNMKLEAFSGEIVLEIWSQEGRLVQQRQAIVQEKALLQVALGDLVSGVYRYRVTGKDGIVSGSFVKQ